MSAIAYIQQDQCTGCGECRDICPTEALIFQNQRAYIDQKYCQGCNACIAICPEGAIRPGIPEPAAPAVIRMPTQPTPMVPAIEKRPAPWSESALPIIGTALFWVGREIIPRLTDFALTTLRRQETNTQTSGLQPATRRHQRGNRPRHRRRQHRHRMKN